MISELLERKAKGTLAVRLELRVRPHRRPRVREFLGVQATECASCRKLTGLPLLGEIIYVAMNRSPSAGSTMSPDRERVVAIARDQRPPINRRSSCGPNNRAIVVRRYRFATYDPPSLYLDTLANSQTNRVNRAS